jgi:hypothetical protein
MRAASCDRARWYDFKLAEPCFANTARDPGTALTITIRAVAATILFASAAVAHAADYKSEYDKNIKATQNIGVLGMDLAGDQTNFYTGSTSFHTVDIGLPGNSGLPVTLGRTYSVGQLSQQAMVKGNVYDPEIESALPRAFGDWDWDIPYISTTMTQAGGWVVDSTTPLNRCSVVGAPKPGGGYATGAPPPQPDDMGGGTFIFNPERYWHGYSLHIGASSQSMLVPLTANIQRPSSGGPYHCTTNKDWWFSCLPTTLGAKASSPSLLMEPSTPSIG